MNAATTWIDRTARRLRCFVQKVVRLICAALPPDLARPGEDVGVFARILDAAHFLRFVAHLEVAGALHVAKERAAELRLELADAGPVPTHASRRVLLRALGQEAEAEEALLFDGQRFDEAHDEPVDLEVLDLLF